MAPMLKALSMRVSRTVVGNPPCSPQNNIGRANSEPRFQQLETAYSDDSSIFSGLPSIQSPKDNAEIQEQFSVEIDADAQSSVLLNQTKEIPSDTSSQEKTHRSRQTSVGKYNMKAPVSLTESGSLEHDGTAFISVLRSGSAVSNLSEERSAMRIMEPMADQDSAFGTEYDPQPQQHHPQAIAINTAVAGRDSMLGGGVEEMKSSESDDDDLLAYPKSYHRNSANHHASVVNPDTYLAESGTMSFESVCGVQRPKSKMNFVSEVQLLNDEERSGISRQRTDSSGDISSGIRRQRTDSDDKSRMSNQHRGGVHADRRMQQMGTTPGGIFDHHGEVEERDDTRTNDRSVPTRRTSIGNEKRITDLLEAYEVQMEQNLNVIRSEDKGSYLSELQDVIPRRVQSEEEKQVLTQHQTRRIRRILSQARTEVEVLKDNNEQFMSEIEQMEEENKSEMKLVEERHKLKITELKATYQQEIDALVKEKDAMIVEAGRQTSKCLEAGRKQISSLKMQIEKLKAGLTDTSVTEQAVDEAVEAVEKKKDAEMAARLATMQKSYEGQLETQKLEQSLQAKLKLNEAVSSVTRRMLADRDREVKDKEQSLRKKFETEKTVAVETACEAQQIELKSLRQDHETVLNALESVRETLCRRYPEKMAEMQQKSLFANTSGPFQLLQKQEKDPKGKVDFLLKDVFETFSFILDASEKKNKLVANQCAEEMEQAKKLQQDANEKISTLEESLKRVSAEKRTIDDDLEWSKKQEEENKERITKLEESLRDLNLEKQALEDKYRRAMSENEPVGAAIEKSRTDLTLPAMSENEPVLAAVEKSRKELASAMADVETQLAHASSRERDSTDRSPENEDKENHREVNRGVFSHLIPDSLRNRRSRDSECEESNDENASINSDCLSEPRMQEISESIENSKQVDSGEQSPANTGNDTNNLGTGQTLNTAHAENHFENENKSPNESRNDKADETATKGNYSQLPENLKSIRDLQNEHSTLASTSQVRSHSDSNAETNKSNHSHLHESLRNRFKNKGPSSTRGSLSESETKKANKKDATQARDDPEEYGDAISDKAASRLRQSRLEMFKLKAESDHAKSEASSLSYRSKRSILARCDPEESPRATVPDAEAPGTKQLQRGSDISNPPSKTLFSSRSYRSKRSILVPSDAEESPKDKDSGVASQAKSEPSSRSFRGMRTSVLVRSKRKEKGEDSSSEEKREAEQARAEPGGSKDTGPSKDPPNKDPVKHKSFAILRSFKKAKGAGIRKEASVSARGKETEGPSEHSRRTRKFRSIFENLKSDDGSTNKRDSLARESLSSLQADPGTSPPQSPETYLSPNSDRSRRMRRTTPAEGRDDGATRESPALLGASPRESGTDKNNTGSKSSGRNRNPFAMFTDSKNEAANEISSPQESKSEDVILTLPEKTPTVAIGEAFCSTRKLKKDLPSADRLMTVSNDTNDEGIPAPPSGATLNLKKTAPADGTWGHFCAPQHKQIKGNENTADVDISDGIDKGPLGEIRNLKKSSNASEPLVLNGKKPPLRDWTENSKANSTTGSGYTAALKGEPNISSGTEEKSEFRDTLTLEKSSKKRSSDGTPGGHIMCLSHTKPTSTLSHSTDGHTFQTTSTSGTSDDDCLKYDSQSQLRNFPPLGDDASDEDSESDSDCTDRYTSSIEPPSIQFTNDYTKMDHNVPVVLSRSIDDSPVMYMNSGESKPVVVQGRSIYRQPEISAFTPRQDTDASSEATTAITAHTFRTSIQAASLASLQTEPKKKLPQSPRDCPRNSMLHPPPPPVGLPPSLKGRHASFKRVEI